MSRNVSEAFKTQAFAQETGQAAVVLLTISHPEMAEPIRLSSDPTVRLSDDPLRYGTSSRGETYEFLPFQVRLPDEQDGAAPKAQIVLDNIERSMVALIRSIHTPATCDIELVLSGSLDTVEAAWPRFRIVNVSYDKSTIIADLSLEALTSEPVGFMTYNPAEFPGLFNDAQA